jgi:hypothetical protein
MLPNSSTMGPKTKTTVGPGAGSIIANWKNKDYSTIALDELLIAIKNDQEAA